ncbi:MAG: hypothetical protein ACOY46_00645 [Bacillota bacterium]
MLFRNNRITVLFIVVFAVAIITILLLYFSDKSDNKSNIANSLMGSSLSSREDMVLLMLGRVFTDSRGLIWDRIEQGIPKGNALLESMGQLMQYAALSGNEELFACSWHITKEYMRSPRGYFYWRVGTGKNERDDATALVDEMRIINSLSGAARIFNNSVYDSEARKMTQTVSRYNVEADHLHDAYEGKSETRDGRISLFFIDPNALREMARLEPAFGIVAQNTLKILQEAPADEHGFFPTWYQYQTGEYNYSPEVNMVEALYTARNAREAGRDISPFMFFLRNEISNNRIYNSYNRDGTPANDFESTAVYALACRLFLDEKDIDSAKKCYDRMVDYQITEQTNPFRGGFGDIDSLTFYAFDQLEALLALHIGGKLLVE